MVYLQATKVAIKILMCKFKINDLAMKFYIALSSKSEKHE